MVELKREDFMRLVDYMKKNYGINLERKQTLVEGRLWSVIRQKNMNSVAEYFDYVMNDATGYEAQTLITRLTTNYSYFMREEPHYKYLREAILPAAEREVQDKDLRIWSAGCSSGEEAFTAAMMIDEYFGGRKSGWDTKILATDISPQVLRAAGQAVYPDDRLKHLPAHWRNRYFTRTGEDQFKVSDDIRREVIFRQFNLMTPVFPFKKGFHLIFCRNVMIYFEKETRDRLVEKFYDALLPGGYLFVGLSETINKSESRFSFVQPSIFRK